MEHGFSPKAWQRAKKEAAAIMSKRLSRRTAAPATYTDIATGVTSVRFTDAHDPRLGYLLGEVSRDEHEKGRGLLSAACVHKTGDLRPGRGFFELARELGRLVGTSSEAEFQFWIAEFKRLVAENSGTQTKFPSVVVVRGEGSIARPKVWTEKNSCHSTECSNVVDEPNVDLLYHPSYAAATALAADRTKQFKCIWQSEKGSFVSAKGRKSTAWFYFWWTRATGLGKPEGRGRGYRAPVLHRMEMMDYEPIQWE